MVFPFSDGQWEPGEDVKDTRAAAAPFPPLLLVCLCMYVMCVYLKLYIYIYVWACVPMNIRSVHEYKQHSQFAPASFLRVQRDSRWAACFCFQSSELCAFPPCVVGLNTLGLCVRAWPWGPWRLRSGGLFCCGPCRPSLLGISTCYPARREPGSGSVFLLWF